MILHAVYQTIQTTSQHMAHINTMHLDTGALSAHLKVDTGEDSQELQQSLWLLVQTPPDLLLLVVILYCRFHWAPCVSVPRFWG